MVAIRKAMTAMHNVPWWRISFQNGEVSKLGEAVENEFISQGPVTAEFEGRLAEALEVPHAVVTTSGSAALLLALMALGIGRDDEVIMPDRTWVATAHAAVMLGAKPVLVDVRPGAPVIDIERIEEKITRRTKAIMPVHLNGRDSGMKDIREIAQRHGMLVIEDAAQAIFSKNESGCLGTQSDAGCFSMAVTKLISTGQGGFVVTDSRDTYDQLRLVGNHGVVDNFTDTWNQMGFNFKFTDLLASFGLVQLSRSASCIAHVHEIYKKYVAAFDEFDLAFLKLIPVNTDGGEVPVYVEVMCPQRDELIKFMASRGVQARPFPPSLHTSDYLDSSGEFTNSSLFSQQGMFLPCGPDQPLENVDLVVEVLRDFAKRG